MTKPKTSDRNPVTFYLSEQHLAEVDAELAAAVAGVPGAKLSRSAWAEQVALRELGVLRAKRTPTIVPAEEPAAPKLAPSAKRAKAA